MKDEGRTLREQRERGGERCYFISLWQKREQTLTLARGFLRAPGLTLLRGCSRTCSAESPSDSHAWSEAAGQAGHVGSSSCHGQTFILRGRSLQSSLVRLSGDPRLLHLSLRRARRRYGSKTKITGLVQTQAPAGAASGRGAP